MAKNILDNISQIKDNNYFRQLRLDDENKIDIRDNSNKENSNRKTEADDKSKVIKKLVIRKQQT